MNFISNNISNNLKFHNDIQSSTLNSETYLPSDPILMDNLSVQTFVNMKEETSSKSNKWKKMLLVATSIVGIAGIALLIGGAIGKLGSKFSNRQPKNQVIPDRINTFLHEHKSDIEEMQQWRSAAENWQFLGEGTAKKVFIHPELPDYVFKIPSYGYGLNLDIRIHFRNLQDAKQIVETHQYDQIVIPESYLIETNHGVVVIEQMFNFINDRKILKTSLKDKAIVQLNNFLKKGDFCDIKVPTNAGFLQGTEDNPKIGIYDFDCRGVI